MDLNFEAPEASDEDPKGAGGAALHASCVYMPEVSRNGQSGLEQSPDVGELRVVALSRIAGWKYTSMSVHTREPAF